MLPLLCAGAVVAPGRGWGTPPPTAAATDQVVEGYVRGQRRSAPSRHWSSHHAVLPTAAPPGSTDTSLWTHYKAGAREYCGNSFPDGMNKNQRLACNVITPTTKSEVSHTDRN